MNRDPNENDRSEDQADHGVGRAEFQEIIDGTRTCPTLIEIECLVHDESEASGPTSFSEKLLDHFKLCSDCKEIYESAQLVKKAAAKARDRIVTSATQRST